GGSLNWTLFAPDNSVVATRGPTSILTQLHTDVLSLAQTGQYRLSVEGTATQAPSYQFELVDVIHESFTIALGDVVNETIEMQGQQDEYLSSASAGLRIYVDFQSITSGTGVTTALYAPDGSEAYSKSGTNITALDEDMRT